MTPERNTEEELQTLQRRLRETQLLAKAGSWELDHKTETLWWSEGTHFIFGRGQDLPICTYEDFLKLVHPDDRERLNATFWGSVTGHYPYDFVHRAVLEDGSIKYLREMGYTIYTDQHQPLRSVGVVQDVTKNFELEDALARKENVLQQALSVGRIGVFDLTVDTQEANWGRACVRCVASRYSQP